MKTKFIFHHRKFVLAIETGFVSHYYGELMYIKFDKPYCLLHFTENIKYTIEIPLHYVMNNLPKAGFMRCNRSTIINLCYFTSFQKITSEIVMEDGAKFRLSRKNVLDFKLMMHNMPITSPPCSLCNRCTNDACEGRMFFHR